MNRNHEHAWPIVTVLVERSLPVFPDHCEHGLDCFVTSLKLLCTVKETRDIDVYLYEEQGAQNVCIRTGNGGGDYISVGTLLDTIQTALRHRLPEYVAAIHAIDKRYKIRAERTSGEG